MVLSAAGVTNTLHRMVMKLHADGNWNNYGHDAVLFFKHGVSVALCQRHVWSSILLLEKIGETVMAFPADPRSPTTAVRPHKLRNEVKTEPQ